MLGERLGELGAVVEEDVHPDARVRAGDARHVAQRAARGGERVVPLDPPGAGLVDEQVGEGMRQVARQRDEAVVRGRIDRDRHGAERGDEAVDEPVALRVGAGGRGQEPRRAVEQLGGRVGRAARLAAADRMAADEPLRKPPTSPSSSRRR